jgi:hypothetical protein
MLDGIQGLVDAGGDTRQPAHYDSSFDYLHGLGVPLI